MLILDSNSKTQDVANEIVSTHEYFCTCCSQSLFSRYRVNPQFCKVGELHRAIYWAGDPLGGIGVSFADPLWIEGWNEDERCREINGYYDDSHDIMRRMRNPDFKCLEVGKTAGSELGRNLSMESLLPFSDFVPNFRKSLDENRHEYEPVLVSWTPKPKADKRSGRYFDDFQYNWDYVDLPTSRKPRIVSDDVICNDYTNRPFNYLYIKKICADNDLVSCLARWQYFTDASLVECRYGYWSPAYALALCMSLQKYGLLGAALRSYADFVRYHPYDPVVQLSESWAVRRFRGVSILLHGPDPVKERVNTKFI